MLNSRKWILCPFRVGTSHLNILKCRTTRSIHISNPYFHPLFIKNNQDTVPTMTNINVNAGFRESVGSRINAPYCPQGVKDDFEERRFLMELLPSDESELVPRRMKDSFVTAVIPLSTNPELRNRYITSCGNIREGRLLEDIDIFAVWIAVLHIDNPKFKGKNPYTIVTGLVDRIHFPFPNQTIISSTEDIRMSGHISWVGKTSLETSIQLDQKDKNGQYKIITEAVIVSVARNPLNSGSALVNPLAADTPEEEAYIKQGAERRLRRKRLSQESATPKPPNEEERDIVHKIFMSKMKSPKLPPNSISMKKTILSTLQLCHPEFRNGYNKIFGGFLIREAAELAYSSALLCCKERPSLLDVSNIAFGKPIEIGSLVRFTATVGYVEQNYIHLPVIMSILDPETGEKDVVCGFQFTFICNLSGTRPVPAVIPNTYEEVMVYLQSRRNFKEIMENRKDLTK